MTRRGLLCATLLLASPMLRLPEQAAAQSEDTPEQPGTATSEAESSPEAPLPPLRMDCASASRAFTLVGKHGCVSGKVNRIVITRSGNTRLYLCPGDQCSFHATVPKADIERVGSLLHLHGRMVAIEGDVKLYHGVPEILVSDIDQIKLAAGGAKHETEPADPGTVRKRRREMPTERAW